MNTIDWAFILEKLILIAIVITASLVIAMYATYAERKVAAVIQDRRGPNRAGPFGILQPLADGMKLFFKEEIIPNSSNKMLFVLGPSLAMLTAMMTCAVIPWGDKIELFGRSIPLSNCRHQYWYSLYFRSSEPWNIWNYDWWLGIK